MSPFRFLPKGPFFRELQKRYPFERECGYFYDGACSSLSEEGLSDRVGLSRLTARSVAILSKGAGGGIVAFNDEIAGWRGVAPNRRWSPIFLAESALLPAFVKQHTFFRDPKGKSDNYYFTTTTLDTFVVFCHEADWHAFTPAFVPAKRRTADRANAQRRPTTRSR